MAMRDEAALRVELEKILLEFYKNRQDPPFIAGTSPIPVGFAIYGDEEVRHVLEVLLSGWISMGRECQRFEQEFARYVGVQHAVAVNSGSSANLLIFTALVEKGLVPKGSEVIVPSATFTTAVSPILQVGLKPVFVDVDPKTYNISPEEIEKAVGPATKAIMVVHTLGLPADMDPILALAKRHRLVVVEDCCEAHGTTYKGKKAGSFGTVASFSFYVAHNMTTGEGGMIVTNDAEFAELFRSLREFGRLRKSSPTPFSYQDDLLKNFDGRYVFQRLGYNVRMTDATAAFGIEQLKKLEAFNQQRIATAEFYSEQLRPYRDFIQTPTVPPETIHTYYAYPLVVRPNSPFTRQQLTRYLEERKIETRALFGGSLADQPAYRDLGIRQMGNLPTSQWLRDNCFFIGCHPKICAVEREYVVRCFQEFLAMDRTDPRAKVLSQTSHE